MIEAMFRAVGPVLIICMLALLGLIYYVTSVTAQPQSPYSIYETPMNCVFVAGYGTSPSIMVVAKQLGKC